MQFTFLCNLVGWAGHVTNAQRHTDESWFECMKISSSNTIVKKANCADVVASRLEIRMGGGGG